MDDAIRKFREEGERLKVPTENGDLARKLQSQPASQTNRAQLAPLGCSTSLALPYTAVTAPVCPPGAPSLEQSHHFQSAGVLLRRLAESIGQWRCALPEEVQPAIIAILHGGIQIEVERLSQESFHGIRIEGRAQGSPCVVLAHQSTVQLLCFVQPIQPPERPRRPIGFVIDGEESQA